MSINVDSFDFHALGHKFVSSVQLLCIYIGVTTIRYFVKVGHDLSL